jgi:hypothetical protein
VEEYCGAAPAPTRLQLLRLRLRRCGCLTAAARSVLAVPPSQPSSFRCLALAIHRSIYRCPVPCLQFDFPKSICHRTCRLCALPSSREMRDGCGRRPSPYPVVPPVRPCWLRRPTRNSCRRRRCVVHSPPRRNRRYTDPHRFHASALSRHGRRSCSLLCGNRDSTSFTLFIITWLTLCSPSPIHIL